MLDLVYHFVVCTGLNTYFIDRTLEVFPTVVLLVLFRSCIRYDFLRFLYNVDLRSVLSLDLV